MNVSIIIVNYNTKKLLADCLNSIFEQTKDISFEVIVSDNGSTDGSIEMLKQDFPQVILIENNANLGFGAANNRGLAIAKGKYILYLNSDTILLNNAVKYFFDFFEKHDVDYNLGTIGTNLLDENGNIGTSYGYFFSNIHRLKITFVDFCRIYKNTLFQKKRKNTNIRYTKKNTKHVGKVDYVIGADMFLKNDKNAFFDEDFFMYLEEIDLQYKLHEQGKNNYIIDTPKIIHLEGKSSNNQQIQTNLQYFSSFSKINNMLSTIIYQIKHCKNPIILNLTIFFTFLSFKNHYIQSKIKEYNLHTVIKRLKF